jgi:hypothetical protein
MKILMTMLATFGAVAPAASQEPLDWLPAPPRGPLWELTRPSIAPERSDEWLRSILQAELPRPGVVETGPGRLKQSHELFIEQLRVKSSVEAPDWNELRDWPIASRDLTTEQTLSVPLPLQEAWFMFGAVAGNSNVEQTQNEWRGRTGVGWKWTPFAGSELQVRTGPMVRARGDAQSRSVEHAQLCVEVQAKSPLVGPLQLKYAGEALPSFAMTEGHSLSQDLNLALPFGSNREVNLGARYRWDDTPAPTPWQQRAELYLGVKFQH